MQTIGSVSNIDVNILKLFKQGRFNLNEKWRNKQSIYQG